jgi:hypothetical protein
MMIEHLAAAEAAETDEPGLSAAEIRGARLKIRIRIGTHSRIRITHGAETVEAKSNFSERNLADLHAALRDDLEKFSTEVARLDQSPENAIKALRRLKKRGRLILTDLFDSDDGKLRQAEELCRRACPNWNQPGWSPNSLAPGTVEVGAAVGDGVPVEILPLFEFMDPERPPEMGAEEYISRLAGSLLGFSAIVKRQLGSDPPSLRPLENANGLPVRLFLNRRVPGAVPVEQYFRNQGKFSFGQAWPDSGAPSDLEEFANALAGHLWQPDKSFTGQPRDPPDQILHFHCHCDTRTQPSGQHALILHTGAIRGGERRVDLDSLRDALYLLRREQPKDEQSGPLVFLNACGSAGVDPIGATSFPQLFLAKGMRFLGVIGTEASIPDEFARTFARKFYDRVLEGVEIGASLYAARWELLDICKNPLGILYTLYAEPEIRVRPREELRPGSTPARRGLAATVSNLRQAHLHSELEHRA